MAIGHLARHHPRATDAAHTHHRPDGERLSRRQAVAVLRLAPFTEREIFTAVNATVRLIETALTKVPHPASSRLPESSKEQPLLSSGMTRAIPSKTLSMEPVFIDPAPASVDRPQSDFHSLPI